MSERHLRTFDLGTFTALSPSPSHDHRCTMPTHIVASYLQHFDTGVLMTSAALLGGSVYLKARAGGRKNTWERDWAGKMIIILVRRSLFSGGLHCSCTSDAEKVLMTGPSIPDIAQSDRPPHPPT